MSGLKGLKGSLRGPWLQRHKMSKVLKVPKVLGRQVLEIKALRVKGFKTCRDISLVYPQGIKGFQGSMFPKLAGFQGLRGFRLPRVKGFQDM